MVRRARQGADCRFTVTRTEGNGMENAVCTRSAWGYCVRYQATARDEQDRPVSVLIGDSDTFFTRPARTTATPAVYGFVTGEESDDGEQFLRFVVVTDQKEAKARYRQSIQL